MIIVLEGPDRVGKTTNVATVVDYLKNTVSSNDVTNIKFPDYTRPTGKLILDYLKSKSGLESDQQYTPEEIALVFAANKWGLLPLLSQYPEVPDRYLVIDRYVASAVVYSESNGCTYDVSIDAEKDLPPPDVVIWLDPSSDLNGYFSRVLDTADNRFDNIDMQQKVVNGYKEFFSKYRSWLPSWTEYVTVLRIDASGTPEQVSNRIVTALTDYFNTNILF